MLLCKNDTVILISLQSRVKLTNCKGFMIYIKAIVMSNSLFAFALLKNDERKNATQKN